MKKQKPLSDKLTFANFDTNIRRPSLTKISDSSEKHSDGKVRVKVYELESGSKSVKKKSRNERERPTDSTQEFLKSSKPTSKPTSSMMASSKNAKTNEKQKTPKKVRIVGKTDFIQNPKKLDPIEIFPPKPVLEDFALLKKVKIFNQI